MEKPKWLEKPDWTESLRWTQMHDTEVIDGARLSDNMIDNTLLMAIAHFPITAAFLAIQQRIASSYGEYFNSISAKELLYWVALGNVISAAIELSTFASKKNVTGNVTAMAMALKKPDIPKWVHIANGHTINTVMTVATSPVNWMPFWNTIHGKNELGEVLGGQTVASAVVNLGLMGMIFTGMHTPFAKAIQFTRTLATHKAIETWEKHQIDPTNLAEVREWTQDESWQNTSRLEYGREINSR